MEKYLLDYLVFEGCDLMLGDVDLLVISIYDCMLVLSIDVFVDEIVVMVFY